MISQHLYFNSEIASLARRMVLLLIEMPMRWLLPHQSESNQLRQMLWPCAVTSDDWAGLSRKHDSLTVL